MPKFLASSGRSSPYLPACTAMLKRTFFMEPDEVWPGKNLKIFFNLKIMKPFMNGFLYRVILSIVYLISIFLYIFSFRRSDKSWLKSTISPKNDKNLRVIYVCMQMHHVLFLHVLIYYQIQTKFHFLKELRRCSCSLN